MAEKKKERGRPKRSLIRQNIVEMLYYMKKGYGYDIYKVYVQIFPKVTMRSVYYNLRKGADTGEIIIAEVKKEKGNYSWGGEVEKIYYALGEKAIVAGNKSVKEFFSKKKR